MITEFEQAKTVHALDGGSHCYHLSFYVPQLYLQNNMLWKMLEHESWAHTTVIAKGIFVLFVVMTCGLPCFLVPCIGEIYRNGCQHLPE
jgi:hypothetical protein